MIRNWDLYYSEESCKIMVVNLGLSADRGSEKIAYCWVVKESEK